MKSCAVPKDKSSSPIPCIKVEGGKAVSVYEEHSYPTCIAPVIDRVDSTDTEPPIVGVESFVSTEEVYIVGVVAARLSYDPYKMLLCVESASCTAVT